MYLHIQKDKKESQESNTTIHNKNQSYITIKIIYTTKKSITTRKINWQPSISHLYGKHTFSVVHLLLHSVFTTGSAQIRG